MTAAILEAAPRPARRRVLRGLPWVTWRQHRLALGGAFAVFGAIGTFLVVNGLAMHHAYSQLGLATCGDLFGAACRARLDIFQPRYQGVINALPPLMMLLPGLLGVFIGAPVVARELESGTYRFAWTQGRSRVRWIVAKLAILSTALTAVAFGFSFLFTWWYGPWMSLAGRMNPARAYEVSGLVFAARTLFAFMLGALAGTLIRRTVPAMAATAAAWLAVVLPSMIWLRALIERPVTVLAASNLERTPLAIQLSNGSLNVGTQAPQTAWQISQWTQDAAGHHLTSPQLFALLQRANINLPSGGGGPNAVPAPAGGSGGTPDVFPTWLAQHGYRLGVSYQPASRFWHFQGVEAAAYVALALLCAAATIWLIRRRTA